MIPVAIAGLVATVAGGGLSAYSSYAAGKGRQAQMQYQAGVAQLNTQIAKQNADYARNVGEVEAQQSGLRTKAAIAGTRAVQGASNLDVNSGSAARVQGSGRDIGWEDQSVIRANAAHRAYGYEVDAMQDVAQSNLYKTGASTSAFAGDVGAGSSLLSTASSVADKWMQGNQAGLWGKS